MRIITRIIASLLAAIALLVVVTVALTWAPEVRENHKDTKDTKRN